MQDTVHSGLYTSHAKKNNLGGRPRGAYSKVSPRDRTRMVREFHDNVPIAEMARHYKISRGYVYIILREEGCYPPTPPEVSQ